MGYGARSGFGVSPFAVVQQAAKTVPHVTVPIPPVAKKFWDVVTQPPAPPPVAIIPPAPQPTYAPMPPVPPTPPLPPPPVLQVEGPAMTTTAPVGAVPPSGNGGGSLADFFGSAGTAVASGDVSTMLKNPAVLLGVAILGFLALRKSGGSRRF